MDKHNRELLMRMHTIMHSTGRVEHRNLDWKPKKRYVLWNMACSLPEAALVRAHPLNFSLGYIKRQEEMQRVQRENQVTHL